MGFRERKPVAFALKRIARERSQRRIVRRMKRVPVNAEAERPHLAGSIEDGWPIGLPAPQAAGPGCFGSDGLADVAETEVESEKGWFRADFQQQVGSAGV
ncbi:MAG: hypothetical protein BWY82_00325 [Verrucomicrobia bacterium ADurb.Bin474]|nr:MAG: hypothetical protein BWY82_00325 [Verrucomicrobia bacterium ADurb.Bin474]